MVAINRVVAATAIDDLATAPAADDRIVSIATVERIVTVATHENVLTSATGETIYPGEFFGSGPVGNGCGLEHMKFLKHGDVVELEVEGIGILRNRVLI